MTKGRTAHTPTRVDLDEVLFAEAERLQRRGHVRVDASAIAPVIVTADRAQLSRLVRNLVDNAERHAATAVALGLRSADASATIWVDDDGPGIPAADRDRVFERFTRLDESRARRTGGTGLGLAIVRGIVERHDGHIAIDDSPLGGARFEVTVPLAASG